MAYQPIQIARDRLPEIIGEGVDSIFAMRRQKQQDALAAKAREEEEKRQKRKDYEAAYAKAQALYQAGDIDGARSLLAPHVSGLQRVQEQARMPVQGGSAVPDGIEQPDGRVTFMDPDRGGTGGAPDPSRRTVNLDQNFDPMAPVSFPDPDRGTAPTEPRRTVTLGEDFEPIATPQGPAPAMTDGMENPVSAMAENPVMAARQMQQQQRAQAARAPRHQLKFQDPSGQSVTMDPVAQEEAMRERRMQRIDSAFAQTDDDFTKQMYGQMRPALAASNEEVDPKQIFQFIQSEKNRMAQDARMDQREEARLAAEQRKAAEFDRRLPMLEAGRDRRAAQNNALRAATVGQGAERVVLSKSGEARQITKDIFANLGFREEQAKNRKFNDMAAQLANKNAALDAASAGVWVKQAQGGTGVISDNDMKQFWGKIGSIRDKADQWVEDYASGKIAPGKRAIVDDAVRWLAGRARSNLRDIKGKLSYGLKTSAVPEAHDQVMGTYFDDERKKITRAREMDQAKSRVRAQRVKGGGKDKLDDFIGGS